MDSTTKLRRVKSKYCLQIIISYIKDVDIKLKLFNYSKEFQKKIGIALIDYKNESKFKKMKKHDQLNLLKYKSPNFLLVNSINTIIKQLYYDHIYKHRIILNINQIKKDYLHYEGFQIYCLIDNIIIGVIEGPRGTLYENGFFLFEIKISYDYPFRLGDFIIITKIFHPNISKNGKVSLYEHYEWSPSIRIEKCILLVQMLLNSPNLDKFVNEEAAKLYLERQDYYQETVKSYTYKYANFIEFQKQLKQYNLKIEQI